MNFYVCQKFESWISLTNYPKLAEILKQKSWVLLRMVKNKQNPFDPFVISAQINLYFSGRFK